jgi:CelD/BcsL family acetyltransferase involved in cellulose biosynthesis
VQGLRQAHLRVERVTDAAALGRFASLIAITRRRKGSLTYPGAFYRSLARNLLEDGQALLELAFAGSRCIAGLLTFCHGTTAIYGYSGSVDDPDDLRLRPINVLLWRGMNWARDRGARTFDLGTSLPSQGGLVHFKEGWGGRTRPLTYYTWTPPGRRTRTVSQDGAMARLAAPILRRLPQPVFRCVTPYVLRELG